MQISKSQIKIQNKLEQKAQQYADKIIRLPFVQMVALTGSVAAGKADNKSDIDYLIIVKAGRLYLTRAMVVIMVKIWRQYRSDNNIAGKLCLNWFIASQSQISNLPTSPRLRGAGKSLRWSPHTPDSYGVIGQNYSSPTESDTRRSHRTKLKYILKSKIYNLKSINKQRIGGIKLLAQRQKENGVEKRLLGKFGNILERLTKKYQIWRIKKDPRTKAKGSEVRWSDQELGFHPTKD